jgi:hypothetical protein
VKIPEILVDITVRQTPNRLKSKKVVTIERRRNVETRGKMNRNQAMASMDDHTKNFVIVKLLNNFKESRLKRAEHKKRG